METNLWLILAIVFIIDLIIPFLLAPFYKGYNHNTMVMSCLGNNSCSLHVVYNVWMGILGVALCFCAINVFMHFKSTSLILSIVLLILLLCYAILDCIISCFFKVEETKNMTALSSKIHGIGSALGSTMLIFAPLFLGLLQFKYGTIVFGTFSIVCFILALIAFILFIAGDKPQCKGTIIAKEGLWQRMFLLFDYLPFIVYGFYQVSK